jgi:hypothetical protein
MSERLASGVHLVAGSERYRQHLSATSHIGDEQNPAIHIPEQETGNFKALFHDIYPRFTEGFIEMWRSRSGFQIDASTNP